MAKIDNSIIMKKTIESLFSKITRRTDEGFALKILTSIMDELAPRYDFLKFVKIDDKMYSEKIEIVEVEKDINSVDDLSFNRSLEDIIKKSVELIERDADFYFIKEVNEAIDDLNKFELEDTGINLNQLQMEYIIEKKYKKVEDKVTKRGQ